MAQLPIPDISNLPLNQHIEDFSLDSSVPKTEDIALKLVLRNTHRAEDYVASRLWMSEWKVSRAIYEAPVKQEFWRDTQIPRASNSYPLCAQHIRAIGDQVMPALFSEDQPFTIDPNEGTEWEVAQAWEGVLAYQLWDTNFKQQIRLLQKDALIFGTGIGKWGWEGPRYKKVPKFIQSTKPQKIDPVLPGGEPTYIHTKESDDLDLVEIEEKIDRPFFKRCEINHVLVDPSLREPDIREAKYVIYRDYLTLRDLNDLRDNEGWNIPSEEELKELAAPPVEAAPSAPLETDGQTTSFGHKPMPRYLDSSEDPMDHKLEVLEHWTNDSLIVVLNRKVVLYNEENELGRIPFVSAYWDDVPGMFYAFGIPRRIGGVQTHVQGLRNYRLDDIHLNLQNMWKVKKGTNIAAQPIKAYPGAVFKVDDMESFNPLEKQPILGEAYHEESVLIDDAEKTTGANEILVQGGQSSGGKGTGMRTAAGSNAVSAASSARIQGFIDVIADQVLIPVVDAFASMSRNRMDPAVMRRVIGKNLWEKLENSYGPELVQDMVNNTDMQFHVLAGANLAAKQRLAATLPLEMQMYMAPAVQQGLAQAEMEVNWLELVRRMEQVTGWKASETTIIPMSQKSKQNAMMSNKNVMNMKATAARLDQMHGHKMQQEQLKNQNALQQIDAKGLANAGEQIITRAIERKAVHDEMPQIGDLEGE